MVGSCTCQKNVQGPCSNCGTYLPLPGDVDYSALLKWLESKQHDSKCDLIDHLCATISRDTDLTECTVESVQSNLGLICSFYKALNKVRELFHDNTINMSMIICPC